EQIGNSNDYIVTFTVTSHVPEYLVVKATLKGSDDVIFPYGNFVYTGCLCPNCSKNFFWEIQGPENGILIGKAEVVSEENICPPDVEISTPVYKVCIKREIVI
ncbi:PIP, partial [Cervus elaphus hippelaphus]